jgi:hypothetical protein
MSLEELAKQYLGGADTVLLFALGVILATAGTNLVKFLLNLEWWGAWHNCFYHLPTDGVMPVVAAIQGSFIGLFLGPAPGMLDNVRASVIYGGGAVLFYYIVRGALARLFPPQTNGGKP